jgi:GTPase
MRHSSVQSVDSHATGATAAAAPLPVAPEAVQRAAADGKPRISIVCCGHVDAGKSTMLGHLLFDLG